MRETWLLLMVLVTSTTACMKTIPPDPPVNPTDPPTPNPTDPPPPACGGCDPSVVTFHPAEAEDETDAIRQIVRNNAQGCKRMRAICRSGSPTDNSFMEFNLRIGGPYVAPTVTALLTCRADRKWYFTDGTTPLAITDVSCSTTKGSPKGCSMCDPSTVMFKKAVAADETDAIMQELSNNAQGCNQMNAICRSGTETDDAFMEFNGGIGGPVVAPTVTARLTCRDDQKWYFTDGTNSLAITEVSCTTTATPGQSCATCDPSAVTFLTATTPDQTNAIMETLANNAQGCRQMNAICKSGTMEDSFMEFNGAIGGPKVAPTVTALLTCRADQKWYFSDGTSALAVTDVGCSVIPEENACGTCAEEAVTFQMAMLPEEVNAMKQTLPDTAEGCKQMNAICQASPGKTAFMEFNSGIGGPIIAETVTSLLTCRDDMKWYFTFMGNSLEVTKIRCTEA